MALTTKIIVKNASVGVDFGMVQLISSRTTANAPFMVFLHGIGERGAGTQASLTTLLNGIPQQIKDGIEKYGWICLAVQSDSAFSLNEPGFARNWGLANLSVNPKQKIGYGLSWGAGGWMGWILQSAANAAAFDCIAVDSMTWPNAKADAAKYIVDANLPLWCGHNLNDNNPGTPPAATDTWVDAINALNPKVQAVKTMFNGPAVHGSWGSFFSVDKIPIPSGSRGMIDPACNVWEWAMSNTSTNRVQVPSLSSNPIPIPTLVPDFTASISGNTLHLDASISLGVKKGWDGYLWGVNPAWGTNQGSYGFKFLNNSPYGGPEKSVYYLSPGKYIVELTVQDGGGKTMKKAIEILIPSGTVSEKTAISYANKIVTFSDNSTEAAIALITTASGKTYSL
jgi:hypothetical protein